MSPASTSRTARMRSTPRTFGRSERIAKRLGKPVAILQDLSGPKLRIGEMAGEVTLVPGQPFTLTTAISLATSGVRRSPSRTFRPAYRPATASS